MVAPRVVTRRPDSLRATQDGDPARPGDVPVPIGVLPASVSAVTLVERSRHDAATGETRLVLGLAFDDLAPATLSIREGEHVIVSGRPGSGRSTTARRLADAWRDCHPEGTVTVVCSDPRSPLADRGRAGGGDVDADVTGPHLVVVDDADGDDERHAAVASLLDHRRSGLCVVATIRPDSVRLDYSHWTRLVRRSRLGVVMTSGGEIDGDPVGEPLPRRLPVPARPGLAYVVQSGRATLVQVACR